MWCRIFMADEGAAGTSAGSNKFRGYNQKTIAYY